MTSSKRPQGVITVFFALSLMLIFALLLGMLESARIQAGRLHLTVAANAAVDSLFSQYHRQLWENYRLLGLESYADEQLCAEMEAFMKPYLEADDWFPMKAEQISVSDMRVLTGEDGEVFEKSVMDYMKYGIAASVMDALDAGNYLTGIRDGTAGSEVADIYSEHTKEAVRLEKSIQAIQECLSEQEHDLDQAVAAACRYDGSGFREAANDVIRDLERLPVRIRQYEEVADRLQAGLWVSEERLEEVRASGDLQEESYEAVREDIEEYESYVEADGERRQAITALYGRAEANIAFMEEMIALSEEIEDEIDAWESSRDDDDEDDDDDWGDDDDDDDDDEEELDEGDFWGPLIRRMEDYDLLTLGEKSGVADPETEQKLENIKTFLEGNLLKLILPENASVSQEALALEDAPSESFWSGLSETALEIPDSLYMTEYIAGVLDYFGRGSYDRDSSRKGSGHLETEYVLYGHPTDQENLLETVQTLLQIRTGLNLVFVCMDSEKRGEARQLALQITGAFGLTPLSAILCFFILSVWALAQAVCDVRDLLAGRRVPFVHSRDSFYLSLEGLLSIAAGRLSDPPAEQSEGFKYIDYLKLLLLMDTGSRQDYRCMDMIQLCLRLKQKDFLMERMTYSLEMETEVSTAHVFSALGPVANSRPDRAGSTERGYRMRVSTAYSY